MALQSENVSIVFHEVPYAYYVRLFIFIIIAPLFVLDTLKLIYQKCV